MADSRRRYDAAYGIRRADDLAAVLAFFEARNGRLHGFRWKDWGDFKSSLPSAPVTPIDQALGAGDGATTAFQLVKRHESGAQAWVRRIVKPVAGTVRIARAGVEATSGWSVDATTGVVTFVAATLRDLAASTAAILAAWRALGGATNALTTRMRLRDAVRHILLGGLIAAGMGSFSMTLVARWLGLPPETAPAGGAAGSAAYLVGVFGAAVIEVTLARIRGVWSGDGPDA